MEMFRNPLKAKRNRDASARGNADEASMSIAQLARTSVLLSDQHRHGNLFATYRSQAETWALKPNDESASVSMLVQTASHLADLHARRLLSWLQTDLQNVVGDARTFLAREVEASYADMCVELKLHPRPWNAVAAKFARLTRQPDRPLKTYTDYINATGKSQRLRCYFIPAPS